MSKFTAFTNIRNFKAQLLASSDEAKRTTLRTLLREERQLLAEIIAERH
jgi:hypothetical protein